MKKSNFLLSVLLVAAMALPSLSCGAEFTIKLQSYYPAGMMDAEKQFADTVAKESGGRIKIMPYSGGELVPSSQILSAVRTGTIGMGRGMGHHFTETPIGSIESGMPLAWTSPEEAQSIFFDYGLKNIIEQEYAQHGVKYLGPVWAAPYHFLSKRPIRSIEDMQKMKIRAVGASAKMLNKIGVKTVSMPPEDIYLALTTGQIDGVLYGSAFEYKTTKYYEGARFFNTSPVLDPIVDNLVINLDLWNSIPADLQQVLQQAADAFRAGYYNWITDKDQATINELFKNTNSSFSPEDMKKMTKAALSVWDEEGAKSEANKKAVELIKKAAKEAGRL
ncbi:TRAP transporter substrate-binding protein DctP [Desulforhopalus singaporensis]|uniref:TRAP-type C4-dicarboxylate transport system, substrate-binding protein n=1 Tax=Desulforhopalus singaporensis TaxID=91360 RepID=A0A1H0N9Q8_9BACT|nr:TRAP transporter substrate-binding protein DctP [Desulforhopalus singaporensis]SDO89401.1 TRAP-type C4-dicarboxylate transport system, substrate-binding protein [Desulforhopalus singaporensis]